MHLPAGPDGRLRGFGFVTLGSAEAANAAIVALRSADVRGRRLMVNIAHPKGAPGSGGSAGGGRGMAPRGPQEGSWGSEPQAPPDEFGGRAPYTPRAKPDEESEESAKKKKKKGGGGGGGAGPSSAKKAARPKQSWRDWDDDDS